QERPMDPGARATPTPTHAAVVPADALSMYRLGSAPCARTGEGVRPHRRARRRAARLVVGTTVRARVTGPTLPDERPARDDVRVARRLLPPAVPVDPSPVSRTRI